MLPDWPSLGQIRGIFLGYFANYCGTSDMSGETPLKGPTIGGFSCSMEKVFFKWAIPGLFFLIVDSKQMFYKSLPMTGFDPPTSEVGSDRSSN